MKYNKGSGILCILSNKKYNEGGYYVFYPTKNIIKVAKFYEFLGYPIQRNDHIFVCKICIIPAEIFLSRVLGKYQFLFLSISILCKEKVQCHR